MRNRRDNVLRQKVKTEQAKKTTLILKFIKLFLKFRNKNIQFPFQKLKESIIDTNLYSKEIHTYYCHFSNELAKKYIHYIYIN